MDLFERPDGIEYEETKQTAPGDEKGPRPSFKSTGDRMTHFYRSPSQEEFDFIQRGMKAHLKQFENDEDGVATMAAVFLARVHKKYGWPLMDAGDLDDKARAIATRDGSDLSKYVDDDAQVDPGKLDIWWISFFATGDTHYLDEIVGQVGDLEAQHGTERILVTHAANWSFVSNCMQHPLVLEHAKSVLARDPPVPNRKALLELVSKAEKSGG